MDIDEDVVVTEGGDRSRLGEFEAVEAVFAGYVPLLGGGWGHC